MSRQFGLIPSPPSKKDFEAEELLGSYGGTPPDSSGELIPFVQIHDQSVTSTCVWFAIAQAIRTFLMYRKAPLPENFWPSTLFGYYGTLQNQGQGLVDRGCIPRIALETLLDLGFCSNDAWPFDPEKVLKHPNPDAYTAAFDQRLITSFYRIFSTGDDLVLAVKMALSKGHPIIYGSPIDGLYEAGTTGILQPPSGPLVGSHMRCLVGYTRDYAVEVNSWGPSWGNMGFGFISWDFIKWNYAHDYWVFDGVTSPTSF